MLSAVNIYRELPVYAASGTFLHDIDCDEHRSQLTFSVFSSTDPRVFGLLK